ncbi:uncharacterized protein BDV17DRAFT_275531 [Aspergillus undulatus]|uniref:uncharacterized protein n=1 Tax=Aspergillus undulatus TaxID=1810928 RepID=UPI003CCDB838
MSIQNGYLLPTELLQLILSFLDIESFYFATRTCKLWRDAALNTPTILRRQLQKVPSLQKSLQLQTATARDLNSLFRRTCRRNLIGLRTNIKQCTIERKPTSTTRTGDIPVRSRNASDLARLNRTKLSIASTSNQPSSAKAREGTLTLNPTIYPSPETVQQLLSQGNTNAFSKSKSFARMQVAVSGCGELVAVRLGQKVHVYLLQPQSGGKEQEQQHAEMPISSAITDSIQSVEFDSDDELLRCEIDGHEGSYVRYLGFRKCRCRQGITAAGSSASASASVSVCGAMKLKYWRIALKRVHLDSRSIEEGLGGATSLRGIRLVPPPRQRGNNENDKTRVCTCRAETHFFSLFRRGNCQRFYGVGCISNDGGVKITQEIPTRPLSPLGSHTNDNHRTVPGLAGIESRTGVCSSAPRCDRFGLVNLPQSNVHDPILDVSEDGDILAICEPPHGQSEGAIYVCACEPGSAEADSKAPAAWPFVLSTLDHGLDSLRVTSSGDTGGYIIDAQSECQMTEWRLQYA